MNKKLILATSALIFSMNVGANATPAEAYCDDLKTSVADKLQESMQRRMPSQMPGDFMNTQFGVEDIISQDINFGFGSINSILNSLINMVKSRATNVQNSFLNEIGKTLGDFTNFDLTSGLKMEPVFSGSLATPGYGSAGSGAVSGSMIIAPSQALSGSAVTSSSTTSGFGDNISEFFRKLLP